MATTFEDGLGLDSIFPEPPRPPTPEPSYATYTPERVGSWDSIKIRLVGNHPLWGHYLWNSALALATYLDDPERQKFYRGLNVLELGAGGALPSIIAAKNGAAKVVVTDYPDTALVDNMEHNVRENVAPDLIESSVSVQGYIWGQTVDPLLECLSPSASKFHLIILSDLIFNHSQHDALLKTCELCLSSKTSDAPNPCVLVFYTHHRPHLAHRDMEFFEKAKERGWSCTEVLRRQFPPMFPEDPGEEAVRATVCGWQLTR